LVGIGQLPIDHINGQGAMAILPASMFIELFRIHLLLGTWQCNRKDFEKDN